MACSMYYLLLSSSLDPPSINWLLLWKSCADSNDPLVCDDQDTVAYILSKNWIIYHIELFPTLPEESNNQLLHLSIRSHCIVCDSSLCNLS